MLGAVFSLLRNKIYFINVICAAAYRRDLKHKNVKNKKFTINHPSMQIQAICKWSLWWWVHLNRPHALPAWLGNYFRESQRLCSRYALVKKHSNGGLGWLVKSACFSCQAPSWNLSCLISCFFCISNWPRVENNSLVKTFMDIWFPMFFKWTGFSNSLISYILPSCEEEPIKIIYTLVDLGESQCSASNKFILIT